MWPPPKTKLSFSVEGIKTWAPIVISVTALFISLLKFVEVDDLSVTVQGYTAYTYEPETNTLKPDLKFTMTFINSGNRPAAITELMYGVNEIKGDGGSMSCDDLESFDVSDNGPFVVKAGEAVIAVPSYKQMNLYLDGKDGEWSGSQVTAFMCLGIAVTIPNAAGGSVWTIGDKKTFPIKSGIPDVNIGVPIALQEPVQILRNWRIANPFR